MQTRHASVYWSSGRVLETRNVSIDMSSDFVEDTVHGDVNKTFAPTFSNFNASISGLYNTGAKAAGNSAAIIDDARLSTSTTFSIYIGDSNTYFYGSGYASVENVGMPYDEFAPFDWSIRSIGAVGHYAK
jgi:hypothetical protein